MFSGLLIASLHTVIFRVTLVPLSQFFVCLNLAYRDSNPRESRGRNTFTVVTEYFRCSEHVHNGSWYISNALHTHKTIPVLLKCSKLELNTVEAF